VSEKEAKKCPKCSEEMDEGRSLTASYFLWSTEVSFTKRKALWFGDKIIPFYCKNCGFIELYKEMEK